MSLLDDLIAATKNQDTFRQFARRRDVDPILDTADAPNKVPLWDGAKWVGVTPFFSGQAAGGVLAGTYPDPSFAQDMATQAELNAAKVLAHFTSGTTSGPTTTSTNDPPTVTLPEMTITRTWLGVPTLVLFTGTFSHNAANGFIRIALFDDGAEVGGANGIGRRQSGKATANAQFPLALACIFTPVAGSHTMAIRWSGTAGTMTAIGTQRQIIALEIPS